MTINPNEQKVASETQLCIEMQNGFTSLRVAGWPMLIRLELAQLYGEVNKTRI